MRITPYNPRVFRDLVFIKIASNQVIALCTQKFTKFPLLYPSRPNPGGIA